MAQWKETLEPYIKVQEVVKTRSLNPVAGQDLIIGCVLISDAGPAVPTLITSQSDFIATYASQDLSQSYMKHLDSLYDEDGAYGTGLPSVMWQNAYRLAGSNNLLITRAAKSENLYWAKPLDKGDQNSYILRDGELLKRINGGFKFYLDDDKDKINHDQDVWSISVNEVGVIGNRTTDEGPQYDYFTKTLPDLVEQLNDTSKFFCPKPYYSTDIKIESDHSNCITIPSDPNNTTWKDGTTDASGKNHPIITAQFEEVYLAANFLDPTDSNSETPRVDETGYAYMICAETDWNAEVNPAQQPLDLIALTDFTPTEYYALNKYNSATELKVRIRRFNHDAVVTKDLDSTETSSLTENGKSQYTVLEDIIHTFTRNGTVDPADLEDQTIANRDFWEVAVWDTNLSDSTSFFVIGNISGRGDISVDEINSQLSMISLSLPDDMHDLNLNYWGCDGDDYNWVDVTATYSAEEIKNWEINHPGYSKETYSDIQALTPISAKESEAGTGVTVGTEYLAVDTKKVYRYSQHGNTQVWANLTIDENANTSILVVNDSDLKKAMDLIPLDEVYTTEGLCDLGNTEPSFQSYMANIAINSNYFYPISTVNSSNYMAIGNSAMRISQNSYKLYMSAPWDIDTGNLGWKFYASPSVLYWEAVSRNRGNNEEFRGVFGQVGGIVSYQKPVTEFNKKTRQLLLSKKVNTVLWNTQTQAWNMNDNYTKQSEDTIMSDEGNSRLMIRISKAIPTLLRQYIGRKISEKLCAEVIATIDYYFKTTIQAMTYNVDAYQIFCDYDEDLAAQNKIKVVINVRYQRSLKYINVVNNAFDVGMDISSAE